MFPRVFGEVKEFLVPSDLRNSALYNFSRLIRDEISISSRFPSESLDLFSRVIPDNPDTVPHELGDILVEINNASPNLKGDDRFVRLSELVNRSRVN